MSPRPRKEAPVEETPVEEVDVRPQVEREREAEELDPEQEERSAQQARQEFNEYIVQLATSAAQQVVAGLEERIRDLEMTRAVDPIAIVANANVPEYLRDPHSDVPEYTQSHQETGDGVPFYRA